MLLLFDKLMAWIAFYCIIINSSDNFSNTVFKLNKNWMQVLAKAFQKDHKQFITDYMHASVL